MTGLPATSPTLEPEVARARRPKWLTLMLLGHLTHEEPIAVSTGTFLNVLAGFGVSNQAVRSTLARLVERGLLDRRKHGRETFYTLTEHGSQVLKKGNARVWRSSADAEWDGTWTVLTFSIPESRRALRLRLRSRLSWGGFGMLRGGVWIAPGRPDVESLIEEVDVLDDVHAFHGSPILADRVVDLISEAYDLSEIADRYSRFVDRWSDEHTTDFEDELCAFLVLRSEWQQLVQADPRFPAEFLPADWPAPAAEERFRSLYARLEQGAIRVGRVVGGTLPDDPAQGNSVL